MCKDMNGTVCEDDFPVISMHISEIDQMILMDEDGIQRVGNLLEPCWTVGQQSAHNLFPCKLCEYHNVDDSNSLLSYSHLN